MYVTLVTFVTLVTLVTLITLVTGHIKSIGHTLLCEFVTVLHLVTFLLVSNPQITKVTYAHLVT